MRRQSLKKNRFATLHEALESEGLEAMWDGQHIQYGVTRSITFEDGTKNGHFISVTRFEDGFYERPVHYKR